MWLAGVAEVQGLEGGGRGNWQPVADALTLLPSCCNNSFVLPGDCMHDSGRQSVGWALAAAT